MSGQGESERSDRPGETASVSDHELVARIAEGERGALALLVQRHQAGVARLAYRFLGNWQGAEDVCQDVFMRVLEKAGTYRPEARFTTWLYRIVANLCWDRRRRARREVPGAAEATELQESREDLVERDETARRVQEAVAKLPDRQRLVLILHRFEGLAHAEIERVTGWSRGAIESCLVRAYVTLRELLRDYRNE